MIGMSVAVGADGRLVSIVDLARVARRERERFACGACGGEGVPVCRR